jgi:ribulose-5-phosphate 4-epimerase/fuculose-1-phosphate aldolase
MNITMQKCEEKMIRAGLTARGSSLAVFREPAFISDTGNAATADLAGAMALLGRDVLLYIEPAEPYKTIVDFLTEDTPGAIYPRDFETRLLLRDLPVVSGFQRDELAAALKRRRGVIVRNRGIVATAGSLDMAFVAISSVCFAIFVKFFNDYLAEARQGKPDRRRKDAFVRTVDGLMAVPEFRDDLMPGPFTAEQEVLRAMDEAGKRLVASGLVDSNFGNISCRLGDKLYISRTGSALDELTDGIVPASLLPEEPVPQTVSTEFPAHRQILTTTEYRTILHGHPKFTVILSMACDRPDCKAGDICQTDCPHERFAAGVPIVSGEAGGGPKGLSHTVPPAMRIGNAAIVYGHGIFTAGLTDYNDAFLRLSATEEACRREYFNLL